MLVFRYRAKDLQSGMKDKIQLLTKSPSKITCLKDVGNITNVNIKCKYKMKKIVELSYQRHLKWNSKL